MKSLGSALLITGTAIGAGMLGIPMATAQLGFTGASLLLVTIWGLSYFAALILLEVTLKTPGDRVHLNSLARYSLGRPGQIAAWICVLGLLYSLTVAYIAGASSILHAALENTVLEVPQWILATVFTAGLGSFVVTSHRATDLLNRSLFSIKTVLLAFVLAFCLPAVDLSLLEQGPINQGLFLSAAPVIFVSFGFHHIIPSLAQYNDNNQPRLKRIIFIGSLIPLLVYLLWEVIALGVLPREGAVSFAQIGEGNVGQFIESLSHLLHRPWLAALINGFANLALITSFLGVSLGLFDFLCDSLQVKSTEGIKRVGVGLLTYTLPLICALLIPTGFIQLLAYGGVFFALMAFVLPPLMLFALRRQGLAKGGWVIPLLVITAGLGCLTAIVLR
jgi:tyrosine-specific transport protein